MKHMKKITCIIVAFAMCFGVLWHVAGVGSYEVNASENTSVNVGVDLNGTENRPPCRYESFEDWVVQEGQSSTFEAEGLTFTLTNETGAGRIKGVEEKNLLSATGSSPLLTLDGVRILGTFRNGAIKLRIDGLPAGTHTITTWHSFNYISATDPRSTMTVTANDTVIAENVEIPSRVVSDDNAAVIYSQFEAKEGEPVEFIFKSDNSAYTNNVVILNAFEIDGVHPQYSINDALPADGDLHFEPENGLSWTAADGAVGHRVYLGTDKFTVTNATTDFPEYIGEITDTKLDLSEYDLDHMSTYYWRVDEVFEDGTVVTGRVNTFEVAHLAFPTAEGYGRFAKAGRGGRIIEVTTLEDGYEPVLDEDGNPVEEPVLDENGNPVLDENGNPQTVKVTQPIKGSLRYALEYEKGPRIVVFKVGGLIDLKSKLVIPSDGGNVYVAGQTAPGDGITLLKYSLGMIGAEDVVIRNIRVRVGDITGNECDGMGMSSSDYCIIDHCSIAWTTDEGFSSRSAKNVTFQWNIIAESLNNSIHYAASDSGSTEDRVEGETERHGFAGSISGKIGSFHHNLLVNNAGRNWSLAGALEPDGTTYEGYLDIRNNVVYNWQHRTNDGGVRQVNIVNNYYKFGHASRKLHILRFDNSMSDKDTMYGYVSGNIMTNLDGTYDLAPTDDAWEVGKAILNNYSAKSDEELFPGYVETETAEECYESVLAGAGANYPTWDYLDTRYIQETKDTTYTYSGSKDGYPGIIDSQEDVGGYPTEEQFKGGEAPLDTDHDGMPDEWEKEHGLNPENYWDASQIYLSDEGYTNIELYLNELIGDPVVYSENPTIQYTPEGTPTEEPTEAPTEVPTATPEITDAPYLLGDVDNNGKVDATDALRVLQHAAKISELDEVGQLAADVTKNGSVDATDALQILKLAAKIIENF